MSRRWLLVFLVIATIAVVATPGIVAQQAGGAGAGAPGPLAADAFDRVVRSGWGPADVGGAWSHAGPVGDLGVDGTRGRIGLVPGSARSAMLDAIGGDLEARVTVRPDQLPVDSSVWLYVVLRHRGSDEIRGRLRIAPDGATYLGVSAVVGDVERLIGDEARVRGLKADPSRTIAIRFRGVGSLPTSWSIRAWDVATPEPSTWAVTVTDSTASLQDPGTIGLRGYLSRSATNSALTLLVDDYLVQAAEGSDAPEPSAAPAILVGAGDIAACGSAGAVATAALLDGIPGTVFAVGDLAYPDGTAQQFADCFGPTWGRHASRMLPALGNHEYHTPGAAGYFGYFGATAAGPGGYYASDLGDWRVYVLNSECEEVSCAADSPQVEWLVADLAANPRTCVVALWHAARFSSGPHGDSPWTNALWEALHAAGAELVLSGHDHDYERFLPMDASGSLDTESGMVQFVVGSGGVGSVIFMARHPNSAVRDGTTHGVLKLTLRPGGYDWRFVPVAGRTFTDSGTGTCHEAP